MQKKFLAFSFVTLLFWGCSKTKTENQEIAPKAEQETELGRKCGAYDVLEEQIKADPARGKKLDEIELFTQKFILNSALSKILADGVTLELPVVVNVLYRTTAENVSQAQIQSQIDVLNKDFAATNTDYSLVPATFQGVRSGNIKIKFVLQTVVRKATNKRSWSTNDAMKKSSQGGINPTTPTTTLNLWVCTLSGGVLGYAQFPGGASATDGVVILNTGFGTTGTAAAPFNKGRTATHEVGHYFNLRHIWGDATCGNDFVGDTPLHNTANFGCPAAGHRSTCSGTPLEMTMNYMDYTDDACMYMFSAGQSTRMKATFAVGGPRASLR